MSSPQHLQFTRRSAIKAGTATGLTLLTGMIPTALTNAAQDNPVAMETPPPATPGAIIETVAPPLGPTIASKAAELEFDIERIFRFVADSVRYEPYVGSLRGPEATLWSLTGNAVDKAVLFSALLDEALVTHRFAIGTLDTAARTALATAATPDGPTVIAQYEASVLAGFSPPPSGVLDPNGPATPESLINEEDQALLTSLVAQGNDILASTIDLATSQASILHNTLHDAGITLGATSESAIPDAEFDRHVWVQIADGPDWLDYAPAFGTAHPSVKATETMTDLPSDLLHMVTFRMVAEELQGSSTTRRDVISVSGPSSAYVNLPVAVTVLPPDDFQGLGFAVEHLISGQSSFIPSMIAGDRYIVADQPVSFGGAGSDFLNSLESNDADSSGPISGETLALYFVVDIASPNIEPVSIERTILDRIGPERRQQDSPDFSSIPPVDLVGDFDGNPVVAELAAAWLLTVEVARFPLSMVMSNSAELENYGPLFVQAPGLSAFRQRLCIEAEVPDGYYSFPGTPQVTLSSLALVNAENPESAVRLDIDLLHHLPNFAILNNATDTSHTVHPGIMTGVLNQAAEQAAYAAMLHQSDAPADALVIEPNVGMIFSAAMDAGISAVAITSMDDLNKVDLAPASLGMIEQALAGGWIVVAPESPIQFDNIPRAGWWLVNPKTGMTLDQMDNGKSYASIIFRTNGTVFAEGAETSIMYRIGLFVGRAFRLLGRRIDCVIAGVALIFLGMAIGWNIAKSASGAGDGSTGITLGGLGAAAASTARGMTKAGGTCV